MHAPCKQFDARPCRRRRFQSRRGATLVELSISLILFLTMVVIMIDMGMAVLRHQQLTEAARFVARQAAVRGNLATALGVWGPADMSGNAANDTAQGNLFLNRMTISNPAELTYTISWPDAGNDARNDDRVRVAATLVYHPFLVNLFGATINLSTTTTVPISH